MGFKKGSFPCKYLGIHLEKQIKSTKIWNNILEKVDKKIENWKGKWLSRVGRTLKIKSVLSAVPTYQMSCLPLTKNVNKKLEEKLRNFFWKGIEEKKK